MSLKNKGAWFCEKCGKRRCAYEDEPLTMAPLPECECGNDSYVVAVCPTVHKTPDNLKDGCPDCGAKLYVAAHDKLPA